jgi:transcriptional regulator with XRE-family HTH domain
MRTGPDKPARVAYGRALRDARTAAGLMQREVAAKSGCSVPTVSKAETGGVLQSASAIAIGWALGVPCPWADVDGGPKTAAAVADTSSDRLVALPADVDLHAARYSLRRLADERLPGAARALVADVARSLGMARGWAERPVGEFEA